ncbi:RIM2-like protein [Rhizoctonia solani AG-1 IA]|uniref:Mitochondrial carrier family n=2 Tax=Rhizoctonia solani TaxID=456999 RepID=A0A8H7H6L2_9AGAM|nr:RIM2-like protein [Rhizoctonia solani AG-1 IA]KAF8677535.1 mitochondrial carrier family [Rhizoctonia solani]
MATVANKSTGNGLMPAKSWNHFVAGGLGGMCGAIVTAPLDVVKTRLQSSLYQDVHRTQLGKGGAVIGRARNLLWNFVETGHILRDIYKYEGVPALFKGLGPTLVGVIPARSINFFTYGNGKQIIAREFNHGQENTVVHLSAAALAGVVTSVCTNPIWVVKTRLQLAAEIRIAEPAFSLATSGAPASAAAPAPRIAGAFHTTMGIIQHEGVRGLYKGLSASLLGVTEGTIQWVLYERFKRIAQRAGKDHGQSAEWAGMLAAAGGAKMTASLITYPHEVLRTRLRQPLDPVTGKQKYTGLWQTLKLVLAEEGARRLYGGLSAHLLRVVPNAAVMYSIYEGLLRWSEKSRH